MLKNRCKKDVAKEDATNVFTFQRPIIELSSFRLSIRYLTKLETLSHTKCNVNGLYLQPTWSLCPFYSDFKQVTSTYVCAIYT